MDGPSSASEGQKRRSRFQKAYSTDVNSGNVQYSQYTRYNRLHHQQKRHHLTRNVAFSSSSVAASKGQTRRKLTFENHGTGGSQNDVIGEAEVATPVTRSKATKLLEEPSTEEEKSQLLRNCKRNDPAIPGPSVPPLTLATETGATTAPQYHKQPQQASAQLLKQSQQTTQRLKASKPIMVNNKAQSQKFRKSLLLTSSGGMTSSMTSTQGARQQESSWRLMKQDFLPGKDRPEPFSVLVEKANDWLKKQPEVRVRSCETVTCMFSDRYWPTNFECMLQSKTILPNVSNHNVRGLRLWLVPKGATNQMQALQVTDFLPTSESDDVGSLVQRINTSIADNTLRGQILTMETISVSKQHNISLDSGATYWRESSSEASSFVYAIRVFTNLESNGRICGSEKVFVGVHDLIPVRKRYIKEAMISAIDVCEPAMAESARFADGDYVDDYEGFEDLMERANIWMNEMWLREEENFLALNLQSLVVQKCPDEQPGTRCHHSMPALDSGQQVDMLRIVRVYFLTPMGSLLVELPPQTPLNFHTISPELKNSSKSNQKKAKVESGKTSRSSKKKLETMTELVKRTNEFLACQGASEEILNVETVVNLVFDSVYLAGQSTDRNDDVKFLLTIRLYTIARRELGKKLNSLASSAVNCIGDTDCNKTSIVGSKVGGCSFDNEESHPGPIFLGHVVNRSYKYRWLVAGATVIFCMTVVVVVSVAYSNIR